MNCIFRLLTLQPCPSFVTRSVLLWPWRRRIFYMGLVNMVVDCGGQTVTETGRMTLCQLLLLMWMKLGTSHTQVMGQSIVNLHLKGDSRWHWGQWKMFHHTHESAQLLLGALHHRNVMESGGRWRRVQATWLPETFNLPLPSLQPCCWNPVCQTRHTPYQVSLIYSILCSNDLKMIRRRLKLHCTNYHLEQLFHISMNILRGWIKLGIHFTANHNSQT